jgi:hypothetical protein
LRPAAIPMSHLPVFAAWNDTWGLVFLVYMWCFCMNQGKGENTVFKEEKGRVKAGVFIMFSF